MAPHWAKFYASPATSGAITVPVLNPPLLVTGIGLASGLGNAVAACAASRASITRPVQLPFCVEDREQLEMVPVTGRSAGDLTLGFSEVGLAVRLISLALGDLLSGSPMTTEELARSSVLLNLPSGYYLQRAGEAPYTSRPPDGPTAFQRYEATRPLYQSTIDKSFRALGIAAPPNDRNALFFGDQAGIAPILLAAHKQLTEGRTTSCLIGGVDSLSEPYWLRAMEALGILKTPVRPIGLIPGEAAAFLRVEIQGRRNTISTDAVLGSLAAVEAGRESGSRFSDPAPVGRVLSDLIRASLIDSVNPVALICDLNGDPPRATDFGHALVRLLPDFTPSATLLPAIAFGDTRAASAFVGTCVALREFARGRAPAPKFLIAATNDDGARAVVRVDAVAKR